MTRINLTDLPEISAYYAADEKLREASEAIAKTGLRKAADLLFEAHPEIHSVRWQQYAPFFNDGEPCTFGVHTLKVAFQPQTAEDDAEDDAEDGGLEYLDIDYEAELSPEQESNLAQFDELIKRLETALEIIFGSDQQITLSRDGIDNQDYGDHD